VIVFSCFSCKQTIKVREELSGKKVKCPHCGQATSVSLTPGAIPTKTAPRAATATPEGVEAPTIPPSAPRERSDATVPPKDGPRDLAAAPSLPAEAAETPAAPPDLPSEAAWPAQDEPARPTVMPQVPGYEVLAELGRGGMGVVYKSRHLQLKRLVALKMVLAGSHTDDAERRRFRIEAEAVTQFRHPGIVTVHDIGETDLGTGTLCPYMALEFVEGGSLDRKLQGAPLPPRPAAQLTALLARAMDAAYQHKVLHRDLKPANVFLLPGTENDVPFEAGPDGIKHFVPKIGDFGLAKRLDKAGQTQTGSIMGTPSYMAPEQAEGKSSNLTPAVDVYALGAILYELLTGHPPFRAATALDTILQVVTEEPVPPSKVNPAVPRESVLTAGRDMTARLWEVWRWSDQHSTPHPGQGDVCVFSPNGKVVAIGTSIPPSGGSPLRGQVHLLAADTRQAVCQPLDQESAVSALGFSPDSQTLLSGTLDGTVRLWQAATGRPVGTPHLRQSPVMCSYFSPDGRLVVTGHHEWVRLWDGRTGDPAGQPLRLEGETWSLPAGNVTVASSVAFGRDGRLLAVGTGTGARLWEVRTGQWVGPLLQHKSEVRFLSFSRDGATLLTGSTDGTARLWDTATGQPSAPALLHVGPLEAAALSPDDWTVLTAYYDSRTLRLMARLWERTTGAPIVAPFPLLGAGRGAAHFSPDGRMLLTTGDSGARLWDSATGRALGPPLEHLAARTVAAFSPDSRSFVTASLVPRPCTPPYPPPETIARFWPTPQPVEGKPERITPWVQVRTGLELQADGTARALGAAEWHSRRQRVEQLGGPPLP
jgi:serine/threonine protein kinase